jgi:ribonuclease-3
MDVNHREKIGQALDFLRQGLYPYVEKRMQEKYGDNWIKQAVSHLHPHQKQSGQPESDIIREDISALLRVVHDEWKKVFEEKFPKTKKTLIQILIEVRNKWAHGSFDTDDAYEALGHVLRLLKAIEAPQTEDVQKQKREIFRLLQQEQSWYEERPIPVSPAEEARLKKDLDELLQQIPFQHAYLLNQALTHTSFKYENPNTGEDNEQLEFLGDAILTFLSGDFLYKRNPDLREGKMTVLRSNLVDNSQLAKFAAELELGQWMRLGKGEEMNEGRSKTSLLSNAFEAVIGAYYIDSGVEAVRDFVVPFFEKVVNDLPTTENSSPDTEGDVKGWFQRVVLAPEFTDNLNNDHPEYKTIPSGSECNPEFISVVCVNGKEYGMGIGRRKKEAEKRAAEDALRQLGQL